MKHAAYALAIAALWLAPGGSSPALAQERSEVAVDVSLFHDRLALHGDWIHTGAHGLAWTPRRVPHAWRPYSVGYWAFTDADWTWVSDEPWGWATYHYGRWYFDPVYGWVWVPDSVWGPAWVVWRSGDGFAGWAPLPPDVDVTFGAFDVALEPFAFTFCEERFLVDRALTSHLLPVDRNVTIVRLTQNVTAYSRVDGRMANRGVDVREVERSVGHAIPRIRLRDAASPEESRMDPGAKELAVYRPVRDDAPPAPAVAAEARARSERAETTEAMVRRHEAEQQRREAVEAQERLRLRTRQEQEKARPPQGVTDGELRRRHVAEQEAQAEHESRERRLMEARQERERQAEAVHSPRPEHPHSRHGSR